MKYKNIICKNVKIIINPFSGKGKNKFPLLESLLGIKSSRKVNLPSQEVAKKVQAYLLKHDIKSEIYLTEYASHATELAASTEKENYDLVIAIGGDGTINEVINGLVETNLPLAVIPSGTANVFSLEFDIPENIELACEKIIKGSCQRIDLGNVGGKYFACMAGIGFDAYVIKHADKKLKKKWGPLSYIIVACKELFTYKFSKIKIKVDDEPFFRKGYFLIVGNTKYYGGKFLATPKADPLDGYLDVCLFKHKNILSSIRYFLDMKSGKIMKNLQVDYLKAKKIKFEKPGRHPIHIDAEYIGKNYDDIHVQKEALWIIN